jgi:protease-4
MSLETDHIVDRRRMRRKLTFWRVVATLIAIIAVVGVAGVLRGSAVPSCSWYVADFARRHPGIIRGDQERTRRFDNLAR